MSTVTRAGNIAQGGESFRIEITDLENKKKVDIPANERVNIAKIVKGILQLEGREQAKSLSNVVLRADKKRHTKTPELLMAIAKKHLKNDHKLEVKFIRESAPPVAIKTRSIDYAGIKWAVRVDDKASIPGGESYLKDILSLVQSAMSLSKVQKKIKSAGELQLKSGGIYKNGKRILHKDVIIVEGGDAGRNAYRNLFESGPFGKRTISFIEAGKATAAEAGMEEKGAAEKLAAAPTAVKAGGVPAAPVASKGLTGKAAKSAKAAAKALEEAHRNSVNAGNVAPKPMVGILGQIAGAANNLKKVVEDTAKKPVEGAAAAVGEGKDLMTELNAALKQRTEKIKAKEVVAAEEGVAASVSKQIEHAADSTDGAIKKTGNFKEFIDKWEERIKK